MKEVDNKQNERDRLIMKVAQLEKQVALANEKSEKAKMSAQGVGAMSLMFPFMQGGQTQFMSMQGVIQGGDRSKPDFNRSKSMAKDDKFMKQRVVKPLRGGGKV